MAGTQAVEQDVALEALSTLSDVASSSIDGLNEVNEGFATAQTRRRQGWSWHRIISCTDLPHSLSSMAGIAARLARAGGGFRRSLAQMLRDEGVRITEIGHILDVSRQRVSALLRRPSQSEQGDSSSPSPSSADAEVTPQSSGVAKVASR
ncbi:MAG: hypothetical protein ABSB52_10460 [Acidimicrobiales bacterium]